MSSHKGNTVHKMDMRSLANHSLSFMYCMCICETKEALDNLGGRGWERCFAMGGLCQAEFAGSLLPSWCKGVN